MKPQDVRKALKALARECGDVNAYALAIISDDDRAAGKAISFTLYPRGVMGTRDDGYVSAEADTYEGGIELLRAAWEKHRDQFQQKLIRKMALAIINITANTGHCTDAALRTDFSEQQVTLYAARACEEANTIASNGPFSIVTLGGSNGAPDKVETPARAP